MSTKLKILFILFTLIAIGSVTGGLVSVINNNSCMNPHSPSMAKLIHGLDSNYKFKTPMLRSMAANIFDYRMTNEYAVISDIPNDTDEDKDLRIFLNSKAPTAKVISDGLSDIAV